MNARGLLVFGATLLAGAAPALAQAPAVAARAPAVDNASTWTLQWENASVSTAKLKDKFYTNGLRLGWTSGPDLVPETLRNLGNTLWGAGEARLSIDLTHQLYNPADTVSRIPPLRDRPHAGVLMGHFGLVQDTASTRSTMVLGLGMVGPWHRQSRDGHVGVADGLDLLHPVRVPVKVSEKWAYRGDRVTESRRLISREQVR